MKFVAVLLSACVPGVVLVGAGTFLLVQGHELAGGLTLTFGVLALGRLEVSHQSRDA